MKDMIVVPIDLVCAKSIVYAYRETAARHIFSIDCVINKRLVLISLSMDHKRHYFTFDSNWLAHKALGGHKHDHVGPYCGIWRCLLD